MPRHLPEKEASSANPAKKNKTGRGLLNAFSLLDFPSVALLS
jgi:hypothetical protein